MSSTSIKTITQPLGIPRVPRRASASKATSVFSDAPLRLVDRFGRVARDLRVSLTDRCNLRCTYCMPAEGAEWIPARHLLSDEELLRLISLAVTRLGIRQVRFTGGEPLLRKSLLDIVAATSNLRTDEGLAPTTALTTNGVGLARKAQALKEAGLDRVNISLDTLDHAVYAKLTRRDRLPEVLAAIEAAQEAGLTPVKLNAVIMPGINEDAILPLAHFALERGAQLRFIEQMPLGPREAWNSARMITAKEIMDKLREDFTLSPVAAPRGSAPAKVFELSNGTLSGRVGIIASVSQPFCGNCDRTRLTADGAVRNCLFGQSETSLRDLVRGGASDEALAQAWAAEMWAKLPGHGVTDSGFDQPQRPMSAIGG